METILTWSRQEPSPKRRIAPADVPSARPPKFAGAMGQTFASSGQLARGKAAPEPPVCFLNNWPYVAWNLLTSLCETAYHFVMLYFIFIVILYLIVNYSLILSFNLWTIYFILDFQWILLLLFFYDNSFALSSLSSIPQRFFGEQSQLTKQQSSTALGSFAFASSSTTSLSSISSVLNWLIYNFLNSVVLIHGIILSNSLLIIFVFFSKVGFFPFFVILVYIWFCVSYLFLIFDLVNKLFYFGLSVCLIHLDNYLNDFDFYLVMINLVTILFFLQFIISIKHVVVISSFIFLFILVLTEDELFSLCFSLYYCFIALITLITLLSFIRIPSEIIFYKISEFLWKNKRVGKPSAS